MPSILHFLLKLMAKCSVINKKKKKTCGHFYKLKHKNQSAFNTAISPSNNGDDDDDDDVRL